MLRAPLAAVVLAASLIASTPALAADPPASPSAPAFRPDVRVAMAVGLLTMLVSGAIGGTRTALGASDGEKTAGLLVASGGFALAPIFSHMITHEWERAAQFGALPVITTVVSATYVYRDPSVVYHGNMGTRTAFGVLLGLGLIGAIVGVADTAAAGDRARAREKNLHGRFFVAPSFDGESAAVTLGGTL